MVLSDGANLKDLAETFSSCFTLSKMKTLLVLYCTYSCCLRFSSSYHITPDNIENEKQEFNITKYAYLASVDTSTNVSNTSYYYGKTMRLPEINVTSLVTDIYDMTSVERSENNRKSRSILDFDENQVTTKIPDTVDFSGLSEKFLNCVHTNVEPEGYQVFPNLSIYVPVYKRTFNTSNYVITQGLMFVCPDFFPPEELEEIFSSKIDTVSIVGTSISSVCIILHLLMFCVTAKLRNLPGYCLFSLCISLLVTYTNSFIQMKIHDQADCKVIAIFMIYSLLSSFFWMNVVSFDVWYAIRLATCRLRLNTRRSMIFRFSMYSLYAWGMPLLFIIIAIIVDNVSVNKEYQLIFRAMTCWFQYRTALLLYFALPVFILLVVNLIFFISSFVMITRTRSDSGSQDSYDLRSQLFLSLRLGSAMGLMWIFGVIGSITQTEWIAYLHSACTALQGVFIFFSFTVNEKTRNACKKLMSKKMSVLSQQTTYTQ